HSERRRLALLCIAEIREDAGRARSFHAAHARQSEQLQFSSEFSIAADFSRLVFFCALLRIWVQLFGPDHIGSFAAYVAGPSGRLRRSSGFAAAEELPVR